MVSFAVDVPSPVARRAVASSSAYVDSGEGFDFAIGGIPFVSAVSRESPLLREGAQIQKDRFDAGEEPGEQSFQQWWTKAQSSFHAGAGALWSDLAERDQDRFRFMDSRGVDPWTEGRLSLLRRTELLRAGVTSVTTGWASNATCPVYASGATVYQNILGVESTLHTASAPVLGLASDGVIVYSYDGDSIDVLTPGGGVVANKFTGLATGGVLAWCKQRLMYAQSGSVYELSLGGGPALPTARFTHPKGAAWKWTAFCDGPAAIYAAGYCGDQSAVYKFVLDSNGVVPTLSTGSTTVELPRGEVIYDLVCYAGSVVVAATSRGVRVGSFDGDDIRLGPLSVQFSASAGKVSVYDRFAYVSYPRSDGVAGLCRIDLSYPVDDQGRFAWATDVVAWNGADVSGTVSSLAVVDGVPYFALATGGLYRAGSSFVASGWLTSQRIRFGTLEPKLLRFARFRCEQGAGSVSIAVSREADSGGAIVSTVDVAQQQDSGDVAVSVPPAVFATVRVTLAAGGGGASSPALIGYQLKALPQPTRHQLIQVPLLLFDSEVTRTGQVVRRSESAIDRYGAMRALESAGEVVSFQSLAPQPGLATSESVVIERLSFAQERGPFDVDGFGGVLTATLRTV